MCFIYFASGAAVKHDTNESRNQGLYVFNVFKQNSQKIISFIVYWMRNMRKELPKRYYEQRTLKQVGLEQRSISLHVKKCSLLLTVELKFMPFIRDIYINLGWCGKQWVASASVFVFTFISIFSGIRELAHVVVRNLLFLSIWGLVIIRK